MFVKQEIFQTTFRFIYILAVVFVLITIKSVKKAHVDVDGFITKFLDAIAKWFFALKAITIFACLFTVF